MMKTTHKKKRPFDFKLINLIEPNQILYQRSPGLSTYDAMKAKAEIWTQIAKEMDSKPEFCISRWNNLRSQYHKELRRCNKICPETGKTLNSTWPYLERLKFLNCVINNKSSKREKVAKKRSKEYNDEIDETHSFEQANIITEDENQQLQQLVDDNASINENSALEESQQVAYYIDEETLFNEETIGTIDVMDGVIENDFIAIADTEDFDENTYEETLLDISRIEDLDGIMPMAENENNENENELEIGNETDDLISVDDSIELNNSEHSHDAENLNEIDELLSSFDNENREIVERRIMAFLCKCQLRSLCNETIEDLEV